ncbi:type VII secretion integral membrane protein EccD [uncultured Corynebacterium sp.]|uniref:type VII secretion integral membrane protein EccD n=1 Tax=uncultured Corynebacterium sp. TaxID=159447 RepID=UPI0025D8DBAD|nr:type VII secretion integral membrane protein EccD [uncultured Corynebacterium sp.]
MAIAPSMIRVRVDFLPAGGAGRRADLLLPGETSVAEVVPELVDVFGAAASPGASWRLRLPDGTVADPESGLAAAGIRDGDRLTVVDDPGPAPAPMVVDVADVLADDSPGVGVADAAIGRWVAAAATVVAVAGAMRMAAHDAVLAAGMAGIAALVAAAGLRIALRRHGSAPTAFVLSCQVLVVSASSGAALTGVAVTDAVADWRFTAGAVPGPALASAALLVLRPAAPGVRAAVTAAGAAGVALSVATGVFAAALFGYGEALPAAAVTVAVAVVGLVVAPGLGVAAAGVRVPRIPAAGEPFPDDPDPADPVDVVAHRAGRLLDGAIAGTAIALVGAAAVIAASGRVGRWEIGLLVAVTVLCLIQSRGHARVVPSGALAATAAAVVLMLAAVAWHVGRWPVAALLVAPLLAGTAVTAIPGTRVTPTTRRILELVEAVAIAVSLPLAAAVADVPDLVAGLVR